jgi:hypothetical protein
MAMDKIIVNSKKAYVFTLDVMLAVIIFILFVSMFNVVHTKDTSSVILFTHEFSQMIDSSDAVRKHIESTTILSGLINQTPSQYCINVQVSQYNSATLLANLTKSGCTFQTNNTAQSYGSTFSESLNQLYVYKVGVWYK